jgi:Lon protease-like protein
MSEQLEELPLFPLNTVLFPYASLRLHVFEQRYRDMIQACIQEDRGFGIVLIRTGSEVGDNEPYLVGTTVRITSVHTYDDGRMDIQVQGERRFRIRGIDESQPYLVGLVEPVSDYTIDDSPETEEMIRRAREEFEALVQRVFSRQDFDVQVVFPDEPIALSFTMANFLPMENLEKQRLLETTDTADRIASLMPILRNQMMEAAPNFFRIGSRELGDWITPN